MRDVEALAARAAGAVDVDWLVHVTRELVRVRSVVEPSKGQTERQAAHFLAGVFGDLGLEPTLEEVAPGRPNLVCDWSGGGFDAARHKTLMFEGHTDVVTEGSAAAWRYPPFAAELVNGRIYGRGSADMKGGIAASVAALKALQETLPELPGRLRFGAVVDEEGMMTGIKHFIEQGWAREVDGAIICEPEENELCLVQKGAMRVVVRFHGVMSHGAMPYAGVNPIPWLGQFLCGVEALQRAEQARLGEHEHLGLPWFTPTIVQAPAAGEAQLNVMPAEAYLALDIRTVPGQEHEKVFEQLREIATGMRAHDERAEIELELLESRPWTQTPPDDPLVEALERAYPLTLGRAPQYGGVPGATDGTFLHAWAGVPIVTVGPGDRTIPHQRDEFIELQALHAAARLYAAAAVLFLMDGV